jgi:omega-6 fatty acid desaturase (delta-12 desaturase)
MNPGKSKEIRAELARFHRKNDVRAFMTLGIDSAAFLGLVYLAAASQILILRIGAGCVAGLLILRLASAAHDAGHLSYVSSRSWNKLIARIAFLPALQPFATWEVAHNVIHHSWTSIRGKDYVWIPYSRADFAKLSKPRQFLERVYRSPLGHGLNYFIDLWILRVLIPSLRWSQIPRLSQRIDILLTGGFAAAWIATTAVLGHSFGAGAGLSVLFAMLLPFFAWCQLFGLTLYLQHTHPSARFFRDREEWEFYSSQSASATNVQFPGLSESAHGLFEHTAHHLDTLIPHCELPAAQKSLNRILSGTNVVYRWSLPGFLECCRICKLYDYERHCWLDFDGQVTSSTEHSKLAAGSAS